jgi:hypothetical protein
MDDGGRTLIDWTVPIATAQPTPSMPVGASRQQPPSSGPELASVGRMTPIPQRRQRFEAGQPVSYADDNKPGIWMRGYNITRLCELGTGEAQYAIRNADQAHDLECKSMNCKRT